MKRVTAFIKRREVVVLGLALAVLASAFGSAVVAFGWDWTGLVTDTGEGIRTGSGRIILVQLPKRLWDWLGLLVVPASLAVGALWFNKLQSESEQRRAADREREDALRSYFDAMSALLLSKDYPLRKSYRQDDVRSVARGRTLSILRAVDAARNAQVLQFLRDSHLLDEGRQIIDFTDADLSGDELQKVNLTELHLQGANLSRADLTGARLREACLIRTDMSEAIIIDAELSGANLTGATLIRANLAGANLTRANLTRANLTGANLRGAGLRGADLTEANLIDVSMQGVDLTDAIVSGEQLAQATLGSAVRGTPTLQ